MEAFDMAAAAAADFTPKGAHSKCMGTCIARCSLSARIERLHSTPCEQRGGGGEKQAQGRECRV